ncbi:MAG: DUF6538 domain-containing protein [Alcanivorax sp.]
MPKPPGLQRRNNTYYIRVRVPQDLINVMKKREVMRSLKTKDYNTACRRCYEERVKINDEFANARAKEKNKTHIRELSKDQKSTRETKSIQIQLENIIRKVQR